MCEYVCVFFPFPTYVCVYTHMWAPEASPSFIIYLWILFFDSFIHLYFGHALTAPTPPTSHSTFSPFIGRGPSVLLLECWLILLVWSCEHHQSCSDVTSSVSTTCREDSTSCSQALSPALNIILPMGPMFPLFWLANQPQKSSHPIFPGLGLQMCTSMPGFYMGSRGLKSALQACTTSYSTVGVTRQPDNRVGSHHTLLKV